MILEKCSGDFCNYKLIEKNKYIIYYYIIRGPL